MFAWRDVQMKRLCQSRCCSQERVSVLWIFVSSCFLKIRVLAVCERVST